MKYVRNLTLHDEKYGVLYELNFILNINLICKSAPYFRVNQVSISLATERMIANDNQEHYTHSTPISQSPSDERSRGLDGEGGRPGCRFRGGSRPARARHGSRNRFTNISSKLSIVRFTIV